MISVFAWVDQMDKVHVHAVNCKHILECVNNNEDTKLRDLT